MHRALGADREARRHQRLAQHLAAEHGGRADVLALGQEAVAAQWLELHERDEFVDEAGGGGGIGGHRGRLSKQGRKQPWTIAKAAPAGCRGPVSGCYLKKQMSMKRARQL